MRTDSSPRTEPNAEQAVAHDQRPPAASLIRHDHSILNPQSKLALGSGWVAFTFGEEMKHLHRNLGIAAAISLLIYLAALWSEAAYRAGDIGFSEKLTWSRMIEAYRLTTFDHVMRVEMLPIGIVAVIGMIGAMVAGLFRHRWVPVWVWAVYLVVLLISGGLIGLLIIPFVPFCTLDGEFLDEKLARVSACGLWTAMLLALLLYRFVKSKKITEQGDASDS